MATVTKPRVGRTRPDELVDRALHGKIRIPQFQRSFRWGKVDIERLFDSIYRGYPIGNLLMWERPAPEALIEIGPLRIEAPDIADALWVVDGQQRITSLVGALAGTAETIDPRFRIFFDLRAQKFVSAGRREEIPDYWLPMPVALRNQDVLRWQRERPWLTEEELLACDAVVTAIRDYEIPMYVVQGNDEQALKEIFDRLNNFGKRLRRSEVFEALHTVSNQMEPSGLHALAASVRGFGFGNISEQVLMQSVLAVRGPRIDRDFRSEFTSDADRHQAFVITERAIGHVIDFLRDECEIPHERLLPYALYVPVLTRFTALFGPPESRAAELLRRWVWRGAVVGPAPQGNTVALRRNSGAIHDEPVASSARLLNLLPPGGESWRPDLSQTRLSSARAKLNMLAFVAQRPKLLVDAEDFFAGDLVDIVSLLDSGRSLITEIISDSATADLFQNGRLDPLLRDSLANCLIHPRISHAKLVNAIASGNLVPEILTSQCLDARCVEALRLDDAKSFLEHRSGLMSDIIRNNVQRRALFGFRDGPDLKSLFDAGRSGPDAA